MSNRKYVIESRRYSSENGDQIFDTWITSANVIEIKHEDQYLVFFPLEENLQVRNTISHFQIFMLSGSCRD